jgi:hypothetical protein
MEAVMKKVLVTMMQAKLDGLEVQLAELRLQIKQLKKTPKPKCTCGYR